MTAIGTEAKWNVFGSSHEIPDNIPNNYGAKTLYEMQNGDMLNFSIRVCITVKAGFLKYAKEMLILNNVPHKYAHNILFSNDHNEIIDAIPHIHYNDICNYIFEFRKLGFEFYLKLYENRLHYCSNYLIKDLNLTSDQFERLVKFPLQYEDQEWLMKNGFYLTREMIKNGNSNFCCIKEEDFPLYYAFQVKNKHSEMVGDNKVTKKSVFKEMNYLYERTLTEYEFTQLLMQISFPFNKFIQWFLPENIHGNQIIHYLDKIGSGELLKNFLIQVPFTKEDIKIGLLKYDKDYIIDALLIKWVEIELRPEGLGSKLLQYVNSYTNKKLKRKSI